MTNIPQSIVVDMKKKKGWWYATSEDLKGLLVASQTFTVFSAEIPKVISALLCAKYGVNVEVVEAVSPDSDNSSHIAFFARRAA